MPAPTNTSGATAIDLGTTLPTFVSQNVHDGGTTYTVWYKITPAVDGVLLVGANITASPATYAPTLNMYTPTFGTLVLNQGNSGQPIQFRVVAGQTYWFEIVANVGNPSPAVMVLQVAMGPDESYAAGDHLVSDDEDNNTNAIVRPGSTPVAGDVSTAPVRKFIEEFATGELGDTLLSGIILHSNNGGTPPSDARLFSAALALIADVTFPGAGGVNGLRSIRASKNGNKFYAVRGASGGIHTVSTVSPAGVIGGTTWSLPAVVSQTVHAIAASNDESILYFAYSSNAGTALKRWDLVNNVALPDLVPLIANQRIGEILVLLDDTLIVTYDRNVGAALPNGIIKHYSAAGVELHSMAVTDDTARLAVALNDPASFWFMQFTLSDSLRHFKNIQSSDFAVLEDSLGTTFGDRIGDSPYFEFGTPFSCPLLVLRAGNAPPSPAPPGTTVRRIRRLRQAPHLHSENVEMIYHLFEVSVEQGRGLTTGHGDDPVLMMQMSKDGGKTWGNERWASVGRLGKYKNRTRWRAPGMARDAVFRVVCSDPIFIAILNAFIDVTKARQ